MLSSLCKVLLLSLLALQVVAQDPITSTTTSFSITSTSNTTTTTTTTTRSTTTLVTTTKPPPTTSTSTSVTTVPTTSSIPSTTSSSRTTAKPTTTEPPTTYTYESTIESITSTKTSIITSIVIATTDSNGQVSTQTIQTVIVTETPITSYATTKVTSTVKPTGVAGLVGETTGSTSSPLSTPAKAGIGAGVGAAVVGAAIFATWFAMRRRNKPKEYEDTDRYTPTLAYSMGPGDKGFATYASEVHTPSVVTTIPVREVDPLARYKQPGSERPTKASTTVSSGSGGYYSRFNELHEGPEQGQYYPVTTGAPGPLPVTVRSSASSTYSDDQQPQYSPTHQRHSSYHDNRLELPGQTTPPRATTGEENPFNTPPRNQLQKQPTWQQGRWDPSQNF